LSHNKPHCSYSTSSTSMAALNHTSRSLKVQDTFSTGQAHRYVVCVLDVSGSMAGSRLRQALRCIKKLILDKQNPKDHFSLTCFNTSVALVCPNVQVQVARANWEDHESSVHRKCGGQTKLWDAVHQAMDNLVEYKPPKGVHTHLMVLTDGDDNASGSGAARRLGDRLANPGLPNFHCHFLACCGASTATMKGMAKGKRHIHVIEEDAADASSIERAMGKFSQQVFVEHRVHQSRSGVVTITSTARGGDSRQKQAAIAQSKGSLGLLGNHVPQMIQNGRVSGGGRSSGGGRVAGGTGGGAAVAAAQSLKPISKNSDFGKGVVDLLSITSPIHVAQFASKYEAMGRGSLRYDKLGVLLQRLELGGCCEIKGQGAAKYVHKRTAG